MAENSVDSGDASNAFSIETDYQLTTGLIIEPSGSKTINAGEAFTIIATLSPTNVSNKNVNWTISNSDVATISESTTATGKGIIVTGKAGGTAIITATPADGQSIHTKTFTVIVKGISLINATEKNYGDYIDYPIDLGISASNTKLGLKDSETETALTDWKIFYKDDMYVYIIAAKEIPKSRCPSGLFAGDINTQHIYWDSSTPIGTASQNLASKFMFEDLSYVTNSRKHYAYASTLLDTNLWSLYVDGRYADYAIGSPTLQMMFASIKQKYGNLCYKLQVTSNGMTISDSSSGTVYSHTLESIYREDTLYVPHRGNTNWTIGEINGLNGYWLATPAYYNGSTGVDKKGNCLWWVYGGYQFLANDADYSGYKAGLRPVVRLKSNVTRRT